MDLLFSVSDFLSLISFFTPQASGLARYLHDSTSQNARFKKFITETYDNKTATSNKEELDRKNDTRWNSTYRCLSANAALKPAIKLYLADVETPNGIGSRFSLGPELEDLLAGALPCLAVRPLVFPFKSTVADLTPISSPEVPKNNGSLSVPRSSHSRSNSYPRGARGSFCYRSGEFESKNAEYYSCRSSGSSRGHWEVLQLVG
jgi:hypothetical protein